MSHTVLERIMFILIYLKRVGILRVGILGTRKLVNSLAISYAESSNAMLVTCRFILCLMISSIIPQYHEQTMLTDLRQKLTRQL